MIFGGGSRESTIRSKSKRARFRSECDTAIEALETALDPDALEAAGRAFGRSFRHVLVLLPLWREIKIQLAWWDGFGRPVTEKNGFPPSPMDRWWTK
jgi:ABC-type oligopeptide transport system substrate-binding subunit